MSQPLDQAKDDLIKHDLNLGLGIKSGLGLVRLKL